MTWVAATATGLAIVLWRPPGAWVARHRLGRPVVGRPRGWITVAGPAAVVVPLVGQVRGPRLLLAVTVVAVSVFALRQVRAARTREQVVRRRREVADVLGLMAAELRAGLLPVRVVAGLADDFPFLGPAARAAERGGDVAAALRESGQASGREAMQQVAAAWHVADRSGAPLAAVLGRLEVAARDQKEVDREVQAGVAPARATGRLMAVLPVVGLALGSGMGGDPVGVLTGTWVGVCCLMAGCTLACLGVVWVDRIAASAERIA